MLIDHIGFCWGIGVFRLIGRIAFPIYVFLIYNGYRHTSSKWRYALRLLAFAVLSQIPHALFVSNQLTYESGNVFFTLFAALIAVWSLDTMLRHKILRWLSLLPSLSICVLYHFEIIQSSYDAIGILMVLTFYFCDRKGTLWKILTVLGLVLSIYYAFFLSCIGWLFMNDTATTMPDTWKMQQIFATGALIPIFLYNDKKGSLPKSISPKAVQYGFYLFYPLHMLILWVLRTI